MLALTLGAGSGDLAAAHRRRYRGPMLSPRTRQVAATCALVAPLLLGGCAASTPQAARDVSAPEFAVPQFLEDVRTGPSWNPNVECQATVTTLRTVLGTERGASGGATFAGGGFKPGIPDRRALHPPCHVNQVPTYVQLNHARVGSCEKINADGDWTCSLWDPRLSGPEDMRRIHIETDQKFRSRSGWSVPPGGTDIRVQGFIFWDPGHTGAAWHNHSGWEIHSFTAWQRAQ